MHKIGSHLHKTNRLNPSSQKNPLGKILLEGVRLNTSFVVDSGGIKFRLSRDCLIGKVPL